MRKLWEWGLFAAFFGMIGWTLCATFDASVEHHWHDTVRVDTLRHAPIAIPVPGPERLRIDTFYPNGGHTSVSYQQVTNTVYADCDTAHGYDTEYGDSLVKIRCHSDVCGRVLASQITYECYQRTVTKNVSSPAPPSMSRRLYAVASTAPGVGLAYTTPRWLLGYSYQPGTPSFSFRTHQLTVGYNLLTTKRHANP